MSVNKPHSGERDCTNSCRGTKFPNSRQVSMFSKKLGENNPRPMGTAYNQRVSNSVHTIALSGQKSSRTSVLSNRTGRSGQRDPGHATQRSSGRNTQPSGRGGFLFQHVPGPQKRWPAETGIQSKKAKYFCTHPTLQNGGGAYVERHSQARRLVSKNRPERCIFHDPSSSSGQEVPEISKSREDISIQVPTIRLSSAPWVFTKTLRPVVTLLRELGLRMVVYIDDILVMAKSEAQLKDHVRCLVYLLENLGYIINYKNSVLTPTKQLEFLGFILDSDSAELRLPTDKVKKIRPDAQKLQKQSPTTARELSRFIGKLNAATKAIPPAPLFYRGLQRDLSRALGQGNQDYEVQCGLSLPAKIELEWWITHLSRWNGRSIIKHKPTMSVETDASLRGWGAICRDVQTGGPWSIQEQSWHINCLELWAAMLAIQCYARDKKSITILLLMDNTTAVSYVNNMGGTISEQLAQLARDLWMWCLQRDIHLVAQHLPGKLNVIADMESRALFDRTDWMIQPSVFRKIDRRTGPLEVDLFASRLTHQLPEFFSLKPDPLAMATDAFLQDWGPLKGYANPPWGLIGRVLSQAQEQLADLVLVAPVWKGQIWYPTLLGMLIDYPLLIPHIDNLMVQVHQGGGMDIAPQLAVWHISGDVMKQKHFHKRLQTSYCHPGGRNLPPHMIPCLENGQAGVWKGIQIPFHVL